MHSILVRLGKFIKKLFIFGYIMFINYRLTDFINNLKVIEIIKYEDK